jgi:hypothetical protein
MGFWSFFKRTHTAECGHKTKLEGNLTAFGEESWLGMKIPKGKKHPEYCLGCLEKMTIRCAWCGKAIFIADPITLYTPRDPEFVVPDHAVVYNEKPLQLVGCLRMDCADSGISRAGFWYPPGEVHRVPSPLELMLAQCERGEGGGMMVCNNLADPVEAHRQAVEILGPPKQPKEPSGSGD